LHRAALRHRAPNGVASADMRWLSCRESHPYPFKRTGTTCGLRASAQFVDLLTSPDHERNDMPASTLTRSAARSPHPDSLPIEAEIRTEDLESTADKPGHAAEGTEETEETEEAEEAEETEDARRQEAEPGRGENAAGFLHPTRR
jgi:hypothetical protein